MIAGTSLELEDFHWHWRLEGQAERPADYIYYIHDPEILGNEQNDEEPEPEAENNEQPPPGVAPLDPVTVPVFTQASDTTPATVLSTGHIESGFK